MPQCVRPSVYLSVHAPRAKKVEFWACYYRTLIANPMLEVKPGGEHRHGTTESGRNGIDLEKFASSISRKRNYGYYLIRIGNHKLHHLP